MAISDVLEVLDAGITVAYVGQVVLGVMDGDGRRRLGEDEGGEVGECQDGCTEKSHHVGSQAPPIRLAEKQNTVQRPSAVLESRGASW